MIRKALYAGSFDPLTNGHLNIIERASRIAESVTVGILINHSKKAHLTLEERMDIISHATESLGNVKIECFEGLLADYVNNNGFDAVVRGLRATADFEYEIQMAQMNARLFTGHTETIFLMTDPKYSFISSSLIKEVVSLGGSVDGLLPEYANQIIKSKLK
ncbi:MAG: pantetheine-phosphate adenylyltransferase [Mogibacterium sp.]|nr:pantetheine-phosphate adenylyltransferase [Mogibacterium sp.]